MKNVLITFDVDGTLTKSGNNSNRLHKRAFEYAFEKVFGVCGTVEAVPLHGKTDQMIILDCLEFYGIPRAVAKPRLKEVMDKMVEYCEENRRDVKQGLELLPGVLLLLQCLSRRDDIVFGLVTGNLEEIAWIKMEGLGIRQFFTKPNFGGPDIEIVGMCSFGSDHTDRGELVNLATRRATKCSPCGFRLRAHIGDTEIAPVKFDVQPADIRAAHHGQALAIGVCTGAFSRCELEHAGASLKRISAEGRGGIDIPTVVLDDLSDLRAFFCALGLC